MIACVRIPAFAAAVEWRDNAHLNGQPFVLVDSSGPAQMVRGASRDALSEGVRIGMTIRQAQTLCPAAKIVAANSVRAHRAADDLMEVLAAFTPFVEMEVPPHQPSNRRRLQFMIGAGEGDGVWFMNPGRLRREQGTELAESIQLAVQAKIGLESVIGLAANRFTARVASGSLNHHQMLLVPRDSERNFLAPYPATLLPIYPEQAHQLRLLGIHTLADLAKLPASALGDLFGKQGVSFKRLAEGRDTTPVRPYVPRRAEYGKRQFDDPVDDRITIHHVIEALVADLSHGLETRGQMTNELAMAVIQAGGGRELAELTLRHPSASAPYLTQVLIEMFDNLKLVDTVKEIEVTFGGIVDAEARQLSLFPPETVPQDKLREVLKRLVARHGADTFFWADLADPDELVPELRYRLRQAEAA